MDIIGGLGFGGHNGFAFRTRRQEDAEALQGEFAQRRATRPRGARAMLKAALPAAAVLGAWGVWNLLS